MRTLPTGLPGCGQPATARFEMYSFAPDAGTYGLLDASLYVCEEHVEPARSAIAAAGLTPFRMQGQGKRCGDGYDFAGDEPGPLYAPDPVRDVEMARWIVRASGELPDRLVDGLSDETIRAAAAELLGEPAVSRERG